MRSALTISALLIIVGGCFGLVTAQQRNGIDAGLGTLGAAIVDDYDSEITGSISLASVPRLQLSDEQRGLVFLGVINLRDVPELDIQAPVPGAPLPESVELHDIPAMVVRRIPALAGYKFVKITDRILVVSAETREVESMIPRYKLVFH